jgi:uncharacterized membrane protein YeaQ/YmgE (transglycosylase-associated protein family)
LPSFRGQASGQLSDSPASSQPCVGRCTATISGTRFAPCQLEISFLEEHEPMRGIFGWIIIGLLAGGLARLLVPGRQSMGCIMTTLLGVIGSFVGGFIASLIFGYDPLQPGVHYGGLFMSVIGAVIVLLVAARMSPRP